MSNLFVLCSALVSFCWVILAYAQKPGSRPEDFVKAHNKARAQIPVGLPPLSWDTNLVDYAQEYANKVQQQEKCRGPLIHSNGPYGENLAYASWDMTAADAVRMWFDDERPYYDINANQCIQNKPCGHYTQMVWNTTTHLGCAKVICKDGFSYVICEYDPPGNYEGERPY